MVRSKSSKRWLSEHFDDPYVKMAQQKGLRSRSAYKLLELQDKYELIKPGMTVVDLGAAPGGWCQVVQPLVGDTGKVLALDILEMEPVHGVEFNLQHLFANSPFGVQFNYTHISGGDVDIDRDVIGEQFILPGLGDSGNFSVFFEDERHTARLALNYRGETVAGFGNYEQPLYVEERNQLDASYQFRFNEGTTFFLEVSNITDEPTRLFARHEEMLFLAPSL